MSTSVRASDLLRLWRHAVPEFVKIPIVEERDCFDDFCVPHLKIPGIGIVVALTVSHCGVGVEQDDDHIAISAGTNGLDMRALNGSITSSMNSFLL